MGCTPSQDEYQPMVYPVSMPKPSIEKDTNNMDEYFRALKNRKNSAESKKYQEFERKTLRETGKNQILLTMSSQ